MFNIFRSNHRRHGSTPSSPQSARPPVPISSATQATLPAPPSQDVFDFQPPSSIPTAPPILPPIPRVASTHDDDRRRPGSSGAPARAEHQRTQERQPPATPPAKTHTTQPSDQSRSPPSAWKPSYSLGLDFEAPTMPQVSGREPGRSPVTPSSAQRPSELIFTLDPPVLPPDDSPASAPPTTSKLSRAYSSIADFGRFDFRRGSKLSTEASLSSNSPTANDRSYSREQALMPASAQHASSPSSSLSSLPKTSSQTNLAAESSASAARVALGTSSTNGASGPRMAKARNLLHPVSLLMRRRASQVDEADVPVAPQRMFEVPALEVPQDYDPRIKGKRVHDFDDESRKPRRNQSTNDMLSMAHSSADGKIQARRSSIPVLGGNEEDALAMHSIEKEHTPIFRENFDDNGGESTEGAAKAIHRESLANQDFLARASRQLNFDSMDFGAPDSARVPGSMLPVTPPPRSAAGTPPTAIKVGPAPQVIVEESDKNSVPAPKENPQTPTDFARTSKNTDASSLRISSDHSTARSSISNETGTTTPPQQTPPLDSARRSLTLDPPFQPTTPLKHLSSNASRVSRFSFQLNSDRCNEQEKALEEKHKAKYASKTVAKHTSLADSRFDEFEDEDFDYDAMADGGYEEEIPELGGDDDDSKPVGLGHTRWSTLDPPKPLDTTAASSQYTTRSPTEAEPSEPPSAQEAQATTGFNSPPARTMTRSTVISDDMYYDDGMIGPQTMSGVSENVTLGEDKPDGSSKTEQALERKAAWSSSPPPQTKPQSQEQKSYEEALQESALRHSSSLGAYHDALASAAVKAAKDGRFSREVSHQTTSSKYTAEGNDAESALDLEADDTVFSNQYSFDDTEDEEDPMVAAANAEVLASDDAEYYGQEFGFYGAPAVSADGQMYNGGYFGQSDFMRAALNARNNEPNLTPITERSEYSTRNSFIGSTPWGPSSAGQQANIGLKDIAASLAMDENDMTLSQLLKLRKAAFEGNGSGPRSMQGSSGSNESSPTSQQNNSSPLAPKYTSSHQSLHDLRRTSELELPDVREAPEAEESIGEASGGERAMSPPGLFTSAQAATPVKKARRQSADVYAQEYQEMVNNTSPTHAQPPPFVAHDRRSSSPLAGLPTVPGRGSPPILANPAPFKAPVSPPLGSPLLSPSLLSQFPQVPSSPPVPAPPRDMMQKFANRPAPDGYRKSWQPSERNSPGGPSREKHADGTSGSTSVAYVRDVDVDGKEKWYLERRRKRSSGDLIVLSREAVQGGI